MPLETSIITNNATPSDPKTKPLSLKQQQNPVLKSFTVKFVCRENENLALAWATKFATKDSIFDRNFSLLGVSEGDTSSLLVNGHRYCQGLLAMMELKSRHDLISRLYNLVVLCKDEITFEVYMNKAMNHVVFSMGFYL
ncbi:Magnesium-protoporphyrin IX monomethyl ester [oxidative] cyclase 2, chloroplastic [Fagus crenata]